MSSQSSSQAPAPPPPQHRPPLAPLPGSQAYADIQRLAMKLLLATLPEPSTEAVHHPRIREMVQRWSHAIAYGEAQIAAHGRNVNLNILRTTLHLQANRTLAYWRMFRFMDLPPEIITNIFRFVALPLSHPLDGALQRLRLTWVCRAWRRWLIDDPLIWNAIWFHDAPPYERSWEWFKRSGSAPLDIRLNEVDPTLAKVQDSPKITAQQMSDILDKLFTKLPQIRMLVVIVGSWPPALTVLDKLQAAGAAGIPINIERLEIHRSGFPYIWIGPGYDAQGNPKRSILFNGQTKRLRYLCLAGIYVDFDITPLSNLTTLDLRHIAIESSPTLMRFREILRSSPNLDKLTLDGCGPQPEKKLFDHRAIELPKLRSFTLGSFNLPFACFVAAQIDAPRLRDLTLMSMTGVDYIPLISMFTRKFTQLRIFSMYNLQLDMTESGKRTFVRFLESIPELAYARLARIKPEVLKMFAENPTEYCMPLEHEPVGSDAILPAGGTICPKFQWMEVQEMTPETIVEFCRWRKSVGVPMKKVYLITPWAHSLEREHLGLMQQETMLYLAPIASKTAEEDMLLTEGWDV